MLARPWRIPLLLVCGALLGACAAAPQTGLPVGLVPAATRQVLLVTTGGWDATDATVQRLERAGGGWAAIGAPIRATVGRSGLGWGVGLHRDGRGPQKYEGDGRAPAGMFELGTAFGYTATAPDGVRVPWRGTDARDYFVDDASSPDYNQWRRIGEDEPNDPRAHWNSCEELRRSDHQYELAMVVAHNAGCVPGRGSAIFLHVWREPGSATSGCTAMDREDLLAVLRWLDPAAQPLLVQAPARVLPSMRPASGG
ncbi:MAG: L,D-transpeptidase family protein [Planctomycetes bacterium]|nr:L,D-transpeptidase family protein [Planctomycetota bacterium]